MTFRLGPLRIREGKNNPNLKKNSEDIFFLKDLNAYLWLRNNGTGGLEAISNDYLKLWHIPPSIVKLVSYFKLFMHLSFTGPATVHVNQGVKKV